MTGSELVTAIVEVLVAGITKISAGVGKGLSTLAQDIFFTTTTASGGGTTTSLSVLGISILAFASISLGLALCRWVVNFFTSLGSRNK